MERMLNITDVAARLSRSASWLYKNHGKLHKENGFPSPIKLNGYNIQWNEAELDMWFNTHIHSRFRTNDNAPGSAYEKLLAANAAAL